MKLYVAGPYRGKTPEIEAQNVALARGVAKLLWTMGYSVLCPHLNTHEFDKPSTESSPSKFGIIDYSVRALTWEEIMRGDIELLDACDGIVMLPAWQSSQGATMEYEHAKKNGIRIFFWPDIPAYADLAIIPFPRIPEKDEEDVLDEAKRITSTDRQGDYGHPLDDFYGSSVLMTGAFWRKLKPGEAFYPWDMPLVHQCTKISRESHTHKRDTPVDGAGYWRTLQMVYDEIKRRGLTVKHFLLGGNPNEPLRQ